MIFENTRSAAKALYVNKLRSSLTMLSISIGVGAIIVMAAIGSGARASVAEQIQSLGSNLLVVATRITSFRGLRGGQDVSVTLTDEDADAMQHELATIQAAAPMIGSRLQVVHGNLNWATTVVGVTPEWLEVKEWRIIEGRPITAEDYQVAAKVVLVGQTVARHLFGEENPLGLSIRIRRVPFAVIGLLDGKGQTPTGLDQDDVVMVPLSTARQKLFGKIPGRARAVWTITVKVREGEDLAEAEEQIRELLRQRHRLPPDREDDFTIRNFAEGVQVYEETARVTTYLLAAIAAIALLLGGVGIMNIMLISVTERTREIGLRMAVGARRRDILAQFLVEAIALSTAGGAIGIAVGLGGSHAMNSFGEWRTQSGVEASILAFGFAVAVGALFGIYPARKAAHLDPIEALRYE